MLFKDIEKKLLTIASSIEYLNKIQKIHKPWDQRTYCWGTESNKIQIYHKDFSSAKDKLEPIFDGDMNSFLNKVAELTNGFYR